MTLRFDPNPEKAAANLSKHGASFDEAASTFGDPDSASVNRALRAFLAINDEVQSAATRVRTRRRAAAAAPEFDPRVGAPSRQASR